MAGLMQVRLGRAPHGGDGSPILMLSLNFLLLAFFILLNSLATRESEHARDVLAQVREGYDIKGPATDLQHATAPWVPKDRWQDSVGARVQGLVVNRLHLQTVPLEVDAQRLVMTLPSAALFAGGKLVQPELVRNLKAAAGNDAKVSWEIQGSLNDGSLAANAAALAAEVGLVGMRDGADGVRITFVPGAETAPGAGTSLQNLGLQGGATEIRGEADGQP
ncbi:MAG: hypothetical protein GC129_03135 [Proteobacteria bacterium]|nr:hypothetical protein [Pseudomonadota bacterium]